MLAARLRDASIRRLRRARTSNWRALPVRAKSAPSEASADSGGGGVSHVLTSYEISIESQLSATPLRFESKGGHKRGKDGWSGDLGPKLWREVRLLRELRPEGATGAPLASRAELFVAGPEPGTALRVGEPGSATAALEKKAAAAGAALVAGEPIPIALSRSSHVAALREALYAHALATMGDEFEVSRDGARGVILTAKPGTPRCDATLENGRVAACQQFILRVEDDAPEDAPVAAAAHAPMHLVVAAGRELRSAMTVRQIMDDASTPNVPESAQVVALGGPHLFGTLAYSSGDATRDAANASIGAPRPELGGDSLLSYHRKRYPARVPLLRDADDGAAPVWLVPSRGPGGGKNRGFKKPDAMAYPAELLAPVVGARASGATDQGVSTGDPTTLQRRVSEIRVALGEPFAPHAKLADRMRRLPPWEGEPSKRVGGVFDGPAIAPSIASIASSVPNPPRTLYVGADRALLAKEVESAMRTWKNTAGRGASTQLDDAVVEAVVADVLASDAEPTPINVETNELESLFRRARDSGYDAVVIHCGGGEETFEAAVREAASRARASRPRRCGPASGVHGSARLALELLSLPGRGGQATAWPGAATVRDTTFVGVAGGKGVGRRRVACVVDGDGVIVSGRADVGYPGEGGDGGDGGAVVDDDDDIDDDAGDEPEDEDGAGWGFGSGSLREWASRSVALAETAVRVALEGSGDASPPGESPPPARLVVHHEGRSHPDFARACVAAGEARGVARVEVVDILREPQAATGRILRWSKASGVRSPGKGTHFALSATDAACVTTEGGPSGDGSVPKPLLVRRRTRGGSSATALASEVVALAAIGVGNEGGSHALPVTLRGYGARPIVLIV